MKKSLLLSLSLLVAGSTLVPQSAKALTEETCATLTMATTGPVLFGLYKFGKWVAIAEKTKAQKVVLKSAASTVSALIALIAANCAFNTGNKGNEKVAWISLGISALCGLSSCVLAESAINEYKK